MRSSSVEGCMTREGRHLCLALALEIGKGSCNPCSSVFQKRSGKKRACRSGVLRSRTSAQRLERGARTASSGHWGCLCLSSSFLQALSIKPSPTFDPSPPVMDMSNSIWLKESFEVQRANVSVSHASGLCKPRGSPIIFSLGVSLPSPLQSRLTVSHRARHHQQPSSPVQNHQDDKRQLIWYSKQVRASRVRSRKSVPFA